MANPFATAALAAGYAQSRPPLHARIMDRAFSTAGLDRPVALAVDLGCGSGLSTRPLLSSAGLVLGTEPFHGMLTWARTVVPEAHFLAARTEALPVATGTADLMTAAGSLNYCEPAAAFREITRVLAPEGAICVYDFSQGRSARDTPALAPWFLEFQKRYPIPPSEAIPLDPKTLATFALPLAPGAAEHFEMEVPMDAAAYEAYIMTESNVSAALRAGTPEADIRAWLRDSLAPVFQGAVRNVVFPGYFAWFHRA